MAFRSRETRSVNRVVLQPFLFGFGHAFDLGFSLDHTNGVVGFRLPGDLLIGLLNCCPKWRGARRGRLPDDVESRVVWRIDKAGSLVPRCDHRCRLVFLHEEAFEGGAVQRGGEVEGFVLPPAAGGGVFLLRHEAQDAEGLEVVRERGGGAAGEGMTIERHGGGADSLARADARCRRDSVAEERELGAQEGVEPGLVGRID